jgi:Fe-S cluster assembly protein SufD
MSAALTSRLASDLAESARSLPPAQANSARRRDAVAELEARGLPGARDENWKYANLRPLERARFTPAAAGAAVPDGSALPAALTRGARYVFVDGRYAADLSRLDGGTATRFRSLADASVVAAAAAPEPPDARFAVLNAAFATDGASLRVSAGSGDENAPVELLFVASAAAASGASYPRLEVSLDPGARLTLIERYVSAAADDSFVNGAATIALGRGAQLRHYRLQELGPQALYFDTLDAALEADASYQLYGVASGAQSARSTMRIRLAGERASLVMALAALGDGQQVQDAFAQVEHQAPRTRTEQTFRGIAAGRSRVAFNGKVVVAPHAAGSDSQQSLRGLLAGPGAEIDVRPQLEIYTDDVRCSHGATAGKLDDNMLFYLLARGLDHDTAQRLLKWAFLGDAIAKIALPEVRRAVETRLAAVLQDATIQELL